MIIELRSWRPNIALAAHVASRPLLEPAHHYREGDDYKAARERMAANYDLLVALALRGHRSFVIAAAFGVTRAAVDKRLHPLGLTRNPPGVRGRPVVNPRPPAASRSTGRESATCPR